MKRASYLFSTKCNAEHDSLWPSEYGILNRTCKCGEELPTTFFNGRSRLMASCPSCKNTIESLEARPIVIPIIGAPSVGKTFFVFSMVYYIKEILTKKTGYKFDFMNTYNFFLSKNNAKSLLFFYDSAGEAFTNTQHLSQHKFYNYFHGLIFIIDPFSIPDIFNEYNSQLSTNTSIRPSSYPLEDVYDASIINLEKSYGFKVTEKITKPVAILLSKVDAFDLQNKIGKNAIQELLAVDKNIKNEQEAMNKLCKDFLSANGMDALLRKIEWKFPNSSFFAISSGGKNSIGIDNATYWLLGKIDKAYNIY